MKISSLFICLIFLIGGCSFFVEPPPIAQQHLDLDDDDKDGIINARDPCSDTPTDTVINNDGCNVYRSTEKINSIQITFQRKSVVIEPTYNETLNKLASFLKHNPETSFELQGHPNTSSSKNNALSYRRINALQTHLIKSGVPATQLTIMPSVKNTQIISEDMNPTQHMNQRVIGRLKGFQGEMKNEWTIFTQRKQ